MLILPNSLELVPHQWHPWNIGYLLIGLGFFLICLIKEAISLYESYLFKKQLKTEKEQLINSTPVATNDSQLTRLITLVFALGVHYFFSMSSAARFMSDHFKWSVLDGVLIGGQTKDTASLWLMLGAICVHMSLVAFSVTLRLLVDNQNYIRVFVAMCLWSLMGPLGVLATLSISSDSSELNLINAVLQCISAGTFVYITFIDMLCDDLIKTKFYPFVNVALVFIGFFVFALAVLWHQHPH